MATKKGSKGAKKAGGKKAAGKKYGRHPKGPKSSKK
jgi:hypothetical protein